MEQNTENSDLDIAFDDMLEIIKKIESEPPSQQVEPQNKIKETACKAIVADMLEGWYCRTMNEEAQRKSPLMTMIEQSQPNALMSLMNEEAQHMNPMISMINDEPQQQTSSMLSLLNEEQQQQNSMMTTLNEQPTMDVSSSVEDDTDEDESGTFDIDYKEMYTDLKKKMKILINENVYFKHSLRSHQKRLLKIIRDRSFLLDQLLKYQYPDVSSSDSDETVESDDSVRVVEPQPKKRKTETSSSQSTVSAMKPPAAPKRNKKTTKKQQQQQQQKQQQQHHKQQQQKHQQRQQQQHHHQQKPPQQQEQIAGPVLPMSSHLAVQHAQPDPQQQQQLLQQTEQLSQSSQDMLDQLPPEDQLILHMQQDKLMDLIKQIPQSQQLLQASQQLQQLMQPHGPQIPQTQQQLMQPMQQQQQPHLQPQQQQQQQILQPQQQPQVVQSPALVNHQHMMQLQVMQTQSQHQPQVQQYLNNPTPQVIPPIRQQQQINQQQIRQHQLDQVELQQLQQHILFQPSTFVQQPAVSSAYQFPLSMMSQVPTELLATASYAEMDVSPGDDVSMESQMTKEELERHLQSRQTMPQVIPEGELPIEMFNNNSSTEPNDQLN